MKIVTLRRRIPPPLIGATFLLLAFVSSCIYLFWGTFEDEGNNLTIGLMISRGYVLYDSIFSHHFPFTYHWVALVFWIFGPSIFALRLSVLVFQILSFALVMRLTRAHFTIGLAALAWSIVGELYLGNIVRYDRFAGVALVVVFLLTISIVTQTIKARWPELITFGLFSTIAILSDPLTGYVIGLAIVILATSSKAGPKKALPIALIIGLCIGTFLSYLAFAGLLSNFYRDAIVFNSSVYNKYTDASPVRISHILRQTLTFLDIFDLKWINPTLMYPLEKHGYSVDHWLFTGFFYRLAIVLSFIVLLMRRQVLAAVFVYIFAAMLLVRAEIGFRTTPFVIISLFSATELIVGHSWGFSSSTRTRFGIFKLNLFQNYFGQVARQIPRVLLGLMLTWLIIRSAGLIISNWPNLSYEANFGQYERQARSIKLESCGLDVALAHYPNNTLVHFFTGMRPVSKYVIMYPWVAEVALTEVIDNLKSDQAIVLLDTTGEIWGRKNAEYLANLKNYLEKNYTLVMSQNYLDQNYYISPQLISKCPQVWPEAAANGSEVAQSFLSQCASLSRITVAFKTTEYPLNFRLKDLQTGAVVYEQAITESQSQDNNIIQEFKFGPLPDSLGRSYLISVSSPNKQSGKEITGWHSRSDVYPNGEAFIDGHPIKADLAFRYMCEQ